jgi:hypothetical protein
MYSHNINSPHIKYNDFLRTYPEPKPLEAPPHTPERIAQAYITAWRNLRGGSVGSDYEASALMARLPSPPTGGSFVARQARKKTLAKDISFENKFLD